MIADFQCNRPLYSLNDDELLSLVKFLSSEMMGLNSRKITLVEVLYREGGWYPSFCFRLTSEMEDPEDNEIQRQVSGFNFGLDIDFDFDEDVILQPLTDQGYQEKWLKEIGITQDFVTHQVGIVKLYNFLKDILKLWTNDDSLQYSNNQKPDEWRTVQ